MILDEARIDPGLRVYAIGDVHGCVDQLRQLIGQIDDDLSLYPANQYKLVFLGDYVDRGPDNRAVIDYLIELEKSERDCVFLLGNHDERISVFLENPDLVWDDVLRWGGAQTLADYGIVIRPGELHRELSERFAHSMPASHKRFLGGLKRFHIEGDYFFCHAGVRPGVRLSDQSAHDLIWIRSDFLLHEHPFEKVIIHGHTPMEAPEIRANRINVDTRCYDTGTLTAVVLEAGSQRFIQTNVTG
ncbi:MAG: metallophosphoesterase family protein [Pseudomonadota bacterium]